MPLVVRREGFRGDPADDPLPAALPRWWFDFALHLSQFVTRGGAIPHIIVLAFLTFGAVIAVFLAWFAGRYPRSLFDDVVGVGRWALRVQAYATLLVTDHYPPFRLS